MCSKWWLGPPSHRLLLNPQSASRFLGTQCFWGRSSTWLGFPKFLCIRRTGHWIVRGLVTFLVCPPPHQLVSFPLCGLIYLCAKVSMISQLPCPPAHPLPPAQSWSWGYCPALSCWLGLQTCGTMKESPISPTAEEWGRLSRATGVRKIWPWIQAVVCNLREVTKCVGLILLVFNNVGNKEFRCHEDLMASGT